MSTKHVVAVNLGLAADSSAIVVLESNLLPELDATEIRRDDYVIVEPVFQLPTGRTTTKHPPLVFAVRHAERFEARTPYATIVRRTKELIVSLDKPHLALDTTGVGQAAVELFRAAGLRPDTFVVTGGDSVVKETTYFRGTTYRVPKADLVSTAQVMLQTGRLKIARGIPLAARILRELREFRMTSPLRGGPEAERREGTHDELVFALAVALWLAAQEIKVPERIKISAWG